MRKKKTPSQAKPKRKRRGRSKRHLSLVPGEIRISNGRVVMLLPRRLKSPNQIKTHWAYRSDREGWRKELSRAVLKEDDGTRIGKAQMIADEIRVKLEVLRLSPSKRYMLDHDNLAYCAKRVQDQLKESGYIVDDNGLWLDGPYVTQNLSADKKYWALITLTPTKRSPADTKRTTVDPRAEAIEILGRVSEGKRRRRAA